MRLLTTLFLLPNLLHAQDFDFYSRGPYRTQVPRPETLLGYRIGSQHTMYHQQQQVLDRLIEAAPDRVRTELIGKTAEGKVMRLLIISAPENLARLEEIRANLAQLADPRRTTAAQARALAERTPVTVLLTHSVHGNEPAGFEAAMQTTYQLLASEEPATLDILKHVVVLVNPSQNPDGHERFAAWYNSIAVGTDEPAAVEQSEPWAVWGRYNHYRFDMNRDQLAQSQNESKALGGVYVRWRPQVVADLHSTTSQYFFPPVAQAQNQNLPPKTYEWFDRFGRGNGQAFDRYSWQYYVRDVFDFFYPGYIDMWPSMRGGVGMTYETDGGPELQEAQGRRHLRHLRNGDRPPLRGLAGHPGDGRAEPRRTLPGLLRFPRQRDGGGLQAAVAADLVHGRGSGPGLLARPAAGPEEIEVTRLSRAVHRASSHAVHAAVPRRGACSRREPTSWTWRSRRHGLPPRCSNRGAVFDSGFVRKQLAAYQRNQRRGEEEDKDGYEFYDITSWSLPFTLGLDAWWTDDTTRITGERIQASDALPAVPAPARAQSAYLFGNASEAGARLAMRLLGEGFRVAVATEPVTAEGVTYPRGTFVARVQRNSAALHESIAAIALEVGAEVTAIRSAFPDSGQYGVGSETVVAIKAPKVLLAAGEGIDQTAFGAIWFYFEAELKLPIIPINMGSIGSADLSSYNVLIIPDGRPSRMFQELRESGATKLKNWVEEGGAVVAVGDAVDLLSRKEVGLATLAHVAGDSAGAKDTAVGDGHAAVSPAGLTHSRWREEAGVHPG